MDRKKLIDYLPPIMQNFKEIKEITKAGQKEVDVLDGEISKVIDNAFIESCDEYGIKKYEKLVGVTPTAQDTLESRKSRVLIRWNNFIPYSYRALIRKLNVFCGVNNYDISGDLKIYELMIVTRLSSFGLSKELETMLNKMLPLNIALSVLNDLEYELVGYIHSFGVTVETKSVTINSDVVLTHKLVTLK